MYFLDKSCNCVSNWLIQKINIVTIIISIIVKIGCGAGNIWGLAVKGLMVEHVQSAVLFCRQSNFVSLGCTVVSHHCLQGTGLTTEDRGFNPAAVLLSVTLDNSLTCMCLSPSSIILCQELSWEVNRHTVRHTSHVPEVLQIWLVPG